VSGRVLRNGSGVPEAEVIGREAHYGASGLARTKTDSTGAFQLVCLFGWEPWLRVTARLVNGEEAAVNVRDGNENTDVGEVEIDLGDVGHVVGRVLTCDGQAIEGARVEARNSVRTDSDGRFDVLANTGSNAVSVSYRGFIPRKSAPVTVRRDGEPASIDVVLDRGGQLMGWVEDETGARVSAYVLRVDCEGGVDGPTTVQTAGDSGWFVIEKIAGTRFRLTVEALGFARYTLEGVEPDSTIEIVLRRP
jgi:hypothetical protein